MFDENARSYSTPIADIGKNGLIKRLTENFSIHHQETLLGVGDDAAILQPKNFQVISSETFVENIHFNLTYTPLKHLGYKLVVAGISDIVAMNASPTHILISLAVSSKFPVEGLEDIYDGIRKACIIYKLDLIGGDVTTITKGLVLQITAIGQADEKPIQRSGLNKNDLLIVTGDLGGAYAGLTILERERVTFETNPNHKPELENYSYVLERHLKPEARTDIKSILQQLEITPTSMMDISDGLSSALLHLCSANEMGAVVYEEKIPIAPETCLVCEEFNLNPTTIALHGGEDFELLFTIPLNEYEKIKHHPDLSVIGHVVAKDQGVNLIAKGSNEKIPITAQAWKNPS